MRKSRGGAAVACSKIGSPVWRGWLLGETWRTKRRAGFDRRISASRKCEALLDRLERRAGKIEAAIGACAAAQTDFFHRGDDGARNDGRSGGIHRRSGG